MVTGTYSEVPQAVHRRIGFRRVEIRANQLLINGAPISSAASTDMTPE